MKPCYSELIMLITFDFFNKEVIMGAKSTVRCATRSTRGYSRARLDTHLVVVNEVIKLVVLGKYFWPCFSSRRVASYQ